MSQTHLDLWHTVREPEQVIDALATIEPWSQDALQFSSLDV